MADAKREISGFFLSADKFASHMASLASPDCSTTSLRLFHNEPHHTAAVVDALGRNASVTAFDIVDLDPIAAGALAGVLSASPRLTSLAVHHPHGADAVQNLCRGISANRTLTRLQFSNLDARGVTTLAQALLAWATSSSPSSAASGAANGSGSNPGLPGTASSRQQAAGPRLQKLQLEKCAFTAEAAAALAAALGGQAGALTELAVVECELGDVAAEALLAAPGWEQLREAASLVTLDLSSSHVGARGAVALSRFLAATDNSSSSGLHSLNLSYNKSIGCEGAKSLAAGLAANRSLRRLDLSYCGVGAAGVRALAAALRPDHPDDGGGDGGALAAGATPPPPPLQQLVLSGNAAGAVGLAALLWAMSGAQSCWLRTLQLDQNLIRGSEFLEALGLPPLAAAPSSAAMAKAGGAAAAAPPPLPLERAELPRLTAPLEQLSLAGNALYDSGVAALAACLAAAPCLEQLDLRENGISDGGVAALLPLIVPRGGGGGGGGGAAGAGRGSGGGAAVAMDVTAAAAGGPPGLQGLLLDGNRLHNVGAQALLEAVNAAPGLWRLSVEANKLTDPGLRLSLTQLSHLRAARHSQLVVLGRQYSSSSSGDSGGGNRGGGGAGGGGGGGGGEGGGSGDNHEASSPMDLDGDGGGGAAAPPPGPTAAGRGGGGGGNRGPSQQHHHHQKQQQHQQQHPQHKHRLEDGDVADGDVSSGDVCRQPLRNVAARGADGLGTGTGGGGGGGAPPASAGGACAGGGGGGGALATSGLTSLVRAAGRQSSSGAWPCRLAGEDGGGTGTDMTTGADAWCGARAVIARGGGGGGGGMGASCDRFSSGGGGASSADCGSCDDTPMRGASFGGGGGGMGVGRRGGSSSGGGGASSLCGSPPPAVCFVTAMLATKGGVGGVGSVGVSKRVSVVGESDHPMPKTSGTPQQVLPACRRPRYKPLTPEQQRLFEDF